jgi:hypothetical protein
VCQPIAEVHYLRQQQSAFDSAAAHSASDNIVGCHSSSTISWNMLVLFPPAASVVRICACYGLPGIIAALPQVFLFWRSITNA